MTLGSRILAASLGLVAIAALFLSAAMVLLEDTTGFMPHGHCYLWRPGLVFLHVSSDTLIGASYVVIASTLAYLVYRARSALPFHWMVLAFGTFIIACGATHLMEVWTLWWPDYWLSGNVKVVTAIASVATAIALPPMVPRALQLMEAERVSEERRVELDERSRLLEEARVARLDAEAARVEAEAANRAKDQFLALVSHELRTPLSPILAWSRMLQNPSFVEGRLQQGLGTIERAARAQAQIVEDLLDVSRISAGKLRLDVRPIELAPVIDAAVEAVRPAADARGVAIHADLASVTTSLTADAERLQQVLWNLLSNSVKFTPAGGRVDVGVEEVGSFVRVTVRDTGIGVPADKLQHVFERFWQADSSTSRERGGLGIGLSIVKYIVELHGGTVSAHSEEPGRGTTFEVLLPRRGHAPTSDVDATVAWAGSDVESRLTRLDGKRILVVDDDDDTTVMLDVLLSMRGATVRTAHSAREALAVLDEWVPHVLISDIGMPDDDGLSLIAELRRRAPESGGRIPAIALTAYARVEDRIRVLESGFQMHVTKPVDPDELVATVGSVLERSLAGESV